MDKTKAKAGDLTPTDKAFASQKAAFEAAVAKTRGEPVETEKADEPEEEKPAKPAKKAKAEEPKDDGLKALRDELAEMKKLLAVKQQKREEPELEEDDYEGIQAELSEKFGEEEGATLAKALKAMVEPGKARIKQMEKMLEAGMKRGRAQIEKSNRTRLQKEYKQLENDTTWKVIQAHAASLMASEDSEYASAEEAYDATVKALYGEIRRAELPSDEDVEEAERIAASQPSQPGRTRKEPKPDAMKIARAQFDYLLKNPEDVAGAQRLASKLMKG